VVEVVGPPFGVVVGPQSGRPRIPVLQVLDGVVDELLVGVVDELECVLGVSLDELCVDVSELDDSDDELDEDDRLLLCVEEWWTLGVLDADVVFPAPESVLVPTGVLGTAVGDGALDEDVSVGGAPFPCRALPDPPSTTAAAPATSSTAVVTAPTSVLRRGPPGPPTASARPRRTSSSPPSSSSPSPSTSESATLAAAAGTSSKVRVASRSRVFSRSGLSTCVC